MKNCDMDSQKNDNKIKNKNRIKSKADEAQLQRGDTV